MEVGRIVAVNVWSARTVAWRGREVTSAIWKSPVGRVPVRGVNVSGDDPANGGVHGGIDMAVYSCRSTDYGWWAAELAEDLAPDTFGRT